MIHNNGNDLPSLPILHSKRLPNPVRFPFTAYSHPHDLLAVVTSTWDVSVFRIASGQSAFAIRRKDAESEITALSWRNDGACLGIGWSDGKYGIYDGGTGKQLHLVQSSVEHAQGGVADWKLDLLPYQPDDDDEEPISTVGVLGWMGHEIGAGGKSNLGTRMTTEEWYDSFDGNEGVARATRQSTGVIELPRLITTLDVTKVLPRLSAIPSHGLPAVKGGGSNHNKFTTQSATDGVFVTQSDSKTDVIQSLLVCQNDGTIQVLLDETVKIGTCHIKGLPLMHAANTQSPGHAILSEGEGGIRYLNIIDLPLQTLGGPLLPVITMNTKRVQNLLDYIMLTLRCIEHDYSTNAILPRRLLQRLNEDLREKGQGGDAVSNLYHLAMAGTFNSVILEWLVETIRDAQYKRWEQGLNGMYTSLQNHIFINLLPALDRFSIAVTTLRGLATFHEGSSKFDCPPQLFSNILDKIDSLRLTAQEMQLIIQSEHRHCRAFLKWLKMQLEIGTAEPLSTSALETEERETPNLDYSLILSYIKETLMVSRLDLHIKDRPGMHGETTKEEFFDNETIRNMSYERAKEALQAFDARKPKHGANQKEVHDPIAPINLPALACALVGHVRVALESITAWQSRMLPSPTSIPLRLQPGTEITDMAMSAEHLTRLLALNTKHPTELSIIEHSSSGGGDGSVSLTTHHLPTTRILSARWIPGTPSSSFLTLSRDDDDTTGACSIARHRHLPLRGDAASRALDSRVLHAFPAGSSFQPSGVLVSGRAGKRVCVVFGSKGREWRVLDLDGGGEGAAISMAGEEAIYGAGGDAEMEE